MTVCLLLTTLLAQCMNLRILKLPFPSPTLHVFVVVYVKPIKAFLFYVVNVQLDLLSHLYFLFIFNSGLPSESFSIWGSTFSISSSAHVLVMNNLIFPWKYICVFSHPHTWRIFFLDMIFLVGSFLSCHTQAILHHPMISIKTLPLSFTVVVLKSNHFPSSLVV